MNRWLSRAPTPWTDADRARVAAAEERAARERARRRARERVARLVYVCACVGLAVALFYRGTA